MAEAIQLVKELVLKDDPDAFSAVLLFMGIWKSGNSQREHVVLSWSPLRQTKAPDVGTIDVTQAAKQWVLDQFVTAILALDSKARALWSLKWPEPCLYFLTKGYCKDKSTGQCQKHHGSLDEAVCSGTLKDMIRINSVFCDLAVLYYRRALNTRFRAVYLGIRRHWTERLLGELTFLSALTQHPAAITRTHTELLRGDKSPVVCSSLQGLLYFRLGKEWSKRNNFTSLLEQLQLAEAFGPNVQSRFLRALSHKLYHDGRNLLQGHLYLLNSIVHGCGRHPAPVFQSNLRTFIRNLDNIELSALSTLHSLTATFESLAACLIIKTCSTACLLTQSWVDLYQVRFSECISIAEPVPSIEQTRTYQQCLVEITKAFCRVLRRFDEATEASVEFLCNGKAHKPLPLRQRNAEMLAVIMANLAAASPIPVGFGDVFREVQTVFTLVSVRAYNLKASTRDQLNQQLALAFLKYNGKDNLLVVVKDRTKGSALASLGKQPGVTMVPFEQLCPPSRGSVASNTFAEGSPTALITSQEAQYSPKEMEATIKVQRVWRFYSVRLSKNRAHMSLPKSRAIARFVQLCTQIPPTIEVRDQIAIRAHLFLQGVALSLKLDAMHAAVRKLQKDAMECLEKVEIAEGMDEAVDGILSGYREVDALVDKANLMMSNDALVGLVKGGKPCDIRQAFNEVDSILQEAEVMMEKAKKSIARASK